MVEYSYTDNDVLRAKAHLCVVAAQCGKSMMGAFKEIVGERYEQMGLTSLSTNSGAKNPLAYAMYSSAMAELLAGL